MKRTIFRWLLATSLLVVPVVLAGGAAYSYWPGSGSGAGSVTTGTGAAVTLSPGTPASGLRAGTPADLRPGGMANVALSVSNPNASAIQIGSFALDTAQGTGGFAVDTGHSDAGCTVDAASLSFATPANSVAGWTVPAKGSVSIILTDTLAMGLDAASACQGATFTVYLAAGS